MTNLCDFCKYRLCGGISCMDCKAYSDSGCLCRYYAGKITVCPYFQEREVKEVIDWNFTNIRKTHSK